MDTRTYAMTDGQEADWDVLLGCQTVAVVAITKNGDVVLARRSVRGPARCWTNYPAASWATTSRSSTLLSESSAKRPATSLTR